jgi:transaldolase
MTNPLLELGAAGQSIWLDYLHRDILENGELARLIERDGLKGLTSNPTIFEKAIGEGDAYDERIETLVRGGETDPRALFERIAVADIQAAADIFRPTYDALGGRDGFVSLEVSPRLAFDTDGTVAEARRLWRLVNRPNVMIKVPGTEPGVPAIRQLVGEGININVTLLFGIDLYLAVAEAHTAGLEALKASGGDVSKVQGVASFFVSRIDTQIDRKIDARLKDAQAEEAARLQAIRGKVAIANAKQAYQRYLDLVATPRWRALAEAGAAPQRLLWASTGVKDPTFPETLYVEALVGPDTIDTMPPKTLDAMRDHGQVRPTLAGDPAGAREVLAEAERLGLDLAGVTKALIDDGVALFAKSYEELRAAVTKKASACSSA